MFYGLVRLAHDAAMHRRMAPMITRRKVTLVEETMTTSGETTFLEVTWLGFPVD